ncbi:RNA-directed DNA polymerase, eukaryota [Tanacetum coccineum]
MVAEKADISETIVQSGFTNDDTENESVHTVQARPQCQTKFDKTVSSHQLDNRSSQEAEPVQRQMSWISYALSWKPCQGDSLNLPDHREPLNNHSNSHNDNGVKRGNSGDAHNGGKKPVYNDVNTDSGLHGYANSYMHVVKRGTRPQNVVEESKLAIVLDETCLNQEDFSNSLTANGKVFWVRAKKVFGWIPDFVDEEEDENNSDGEFKEDGLYDENVEKQEYTNTGGESDVEEKKQGNINGDTNLNDTMKYPPGFTPKATDEVHSNDFKEVETEADECLQNIQDDIANSEVGKTCHKSNSKEDKEESICSGHFKKFELPHTGGSMLQLMEDLVKMNFMSLNIQGLAQKAKKIGLRSYVLTTRGKWISNGKKLLIISIYAPQELSEKKMLWDYLIGVIHNWNGDVIIMGDFNEVRTQAERYGSIFNAHGAAAFNSFILAAGLEEVPLGGCSFTWCHKSANKMSKLDRFLISEGLMGSCLNISASTLDRYLSDHRFDTFVERTWNKTNISDSNAISKFMKKMKFLKDHIRVWVKNKKEYAYKQKKTLKEKLTDIDLLLDKGEGDSEVIAQRAAIFKSLQDIEKLDSMEVAQKIKIKWAIEGDENSKYYHGILNKRRNQLTIRGILVDGTWIDSPSLVKREFLSHFSNRFDQPGTSCVLLNMEFPNKLNLDQQIDLESDVTRDKIKRAIWDYGIDKSPGLDGFTFGFYRRYWSFLEIDVVQAVKYFFPACFSTGVKRKKKQSMFFKVDFEKAYDSVRWDYLDDVLKNFGFGYRWRGLKRGDPLSPFLFILVMESLHISVQRVVDADMFKGISLGSSLHLSHLFYADDAVFLGQWRSSNVDIIIQAKVTKGIHGEDGKLCKNIKQSHSSIWLDIVRETIILKNKGTDLCGFIHKKMGNGIDTSFWNDVWKGDTAFKFLYPRIYALESCKNIMVAEKMSHETLVFSLRRDPRGGIEQEQFGQLLANVEGTVLANSCDRWVWSKEGSGDFSVASARRTIDDRWLPIVSAKTRWISVVPIKINVHAWKVRLNGLPTRMNISRRGMDIESILCHSCGVAVETTSHVFFSCHIAREVFRKIANWWDVNFMELSSYEEWLEWLLNLRLHSKHKKMIEGVCYTMWWSIWNFRNKSIFGSHTPSKAALFEDIVSRSFYWCRYRSKASFSWLDWLKNPHLVTL